MKTEMFSRWLSRDPEASWIKVEAALRRMGHNTEADGVRERYLGGARTDDAAAQQPTPPHQQPGSYVRSSSNIYPDIAANLTMFFFGFSEKLGEINQLTTRGAEVALSGPFGHENNLLMFTDGLVISKKSWNSAENKKTNFVSYFAKEELRKKITLGKDLTPNQKRYLLQANTAVYSCNELINDKIYQELFKSLKNAVPLPYISDDERKQMQTKLTEKCMKFDHPKFLPAKMRTLAKGEDTKYYKTGKPSAASCK